MQSYNSKRKKARKVHKDMLLQSFLEQASKNPIVKHTPDEDLGIQVELTGDEDIYCFKVTVDDVVIRLHTRSAIDLHRKIGQALCDWISESVLMVSGMLDEEGEAISAAV